MKKLFVVIVLAVLSLGLGKQAFGQTVSVGYLNSAYVMKDGGASLSFKGSGVYGGVDMDFAIGAADLYFSPGFFVDFVKFKVYDNASANLFYLRAPLHLKYNITLSGINLFATAGPSLVYALAGKYRYKDGGISYSEDFFDETDIQRFDIPLGFTVGANVAYNLRIEFGYDFGLLNQTNDSYVRCSKNILHFGVGYSF